jgi:hypothetical protein
MNAAAQTSESVPVTFENFKRAESDLYFGNAVKEAGGTGRFFHHRQPMPIDHQTVIRANRDTLYSAVVIDLDAGPVSITLPDAGRRYRSMQVIDEDHYVVGDIVYDAGTCTYDRQRVGTRYVLLALRTLIDPGDPEDIRQAHALQAATQLSQTAFGKFEIPPWSTDDQKKVREALLVLASGMPDFKGAFGTKDGVDPVRHLIGTAAGWGGNPASAAIYLNETPARNDGKTVHKLSVKDVPVDGFWSISVYDAEGYFQKNDLNAYSINNMTAKKSADGCIEVQFGGCEAEATNCLPIVPGWNYTVRLYRPRRALIDDTWKFPKARPVS